MLYNEAMKKYLKIVVAFLAVTALFASGKKETAVVHVAALNGPSAIPMAYLFENPPVFDGVQSEFEVAAGPDILLPKLIKGEVDIGILPINAAAKVYNANNGAVILGAIVGEGMVNLVTRDAAVNSLTDLRGKRVYVAGQGATPDYLFRYLLAANGVDDVALDFSIPPPELAAALISGRIDYAVVPEPFSTVVTSASNDFRRAIDFQKEYAALQNSTYPITALVIRADFAKKNPKAVRQFLTAMQEAIDWTNANPTNAGALVQAYTLGLQAPIAARSIRTSAFKFSTASASRQSVEKLLKIFLATDPTSIGGKLPDDGFYSTATPEARSIFHLVENNLD
jgi:NitT/TauT family transport system substrate-binding protein